MAQPSDIALVREYIDETDDSRGWTDARIGTYVDKASNTYLAAADIWTAKAGAYASAVDVTESGSSRSLGALQKNALNMAGEYRRLGKEAAGIVDNTSAPFTMAIRRGSR